MSNDFSDDAAVVRLGGGERAAVLTADVIAPLVDDPEQFGAIAAANSISDVYAMGGRPLFALNLVFFPDDLLPASVLRAILHGGRQVCDRAGVIVVGGHTVRDDDLKFGLSVTGEVAPDAVLSNRTATAGQALVLSKAIGTGVIGQAIKKGDAAPGEIEAAVASMTTLNAEALAAGRRHGVTACTDITGFGFLGHLRNIVRGSGLGAEIHVGEVPLLPGALEHARAGRIPGGSKANLAFLQPMLEVGDGVDPLRVQLLADAQTSGGLLLCVPAAAAADLVADLRQSGHAAARVGTLVPGDNARLV